MGTELWNLITFLVVIGGIAGVAVVLSGSLQSIAV